MRHGASLGTDDAGGDGRSKLVAQRTAHGQHPLSEPQLVGITERKGRKSLGVNLYQCDIGGRVCTDHLSFVGLVVVQCHLHLGGVRDNVVVGHDVAVRTDDHTRAASLLLPCLRLAIPEEEAEERIGHLILLRHGHLYIDDSVHGGLRRIGQVRIVRLCQIDSPCDRPVLCPCHFVSLIHGGRLHDTVSRQHAEQH